MMNSQESISLNEGIKVEFHTGSNCVEFSFRETIELISIEEFNRVKKELHEQRISDLNFQEQVGNRVSDVELNIDHESKTFAITEKYITNLIYGSDIASDQLWFITQLKEVVRLFELKYKLYYDDKIIETKEEFENKFLKGLYKFVSINKTISEYDERYGTLWYEKR